MSAEQTERFSTWGGRVYGGIGLVGVALVGIGLGGDSHPAAYVGCALVALVLWAALLRPAVYVAEGRLVLRNPFTTVRIPLAAIEKVVVRQFLVVGAGGRSFTNSGVGRSRRQGLRDDQRGDVTGVDIAELSFGALTEHRIDRLAEDARDRAGIARYSDEQEALAAQVEREPAWIEIGIAAVLLLALLVTFLV